MYIFGIRRNGPERSCKSVLFLVWYGRCVVRTLSRRYLCGACIFINLNASQCMQYRSSRLVICSRSRGVRWLNGSSVGSCMGRNCRGVVLVRGAISYMQLVCMHLRLDRDDERRGASQDWCVCVCRSAVAYSYGERVPGCSPDIGRVRHKRKPGECADACGQICAWLPVRLSTLDVSWP